jgi:signal peptidase I
VYVDGVAINEPYVKGNTADFGKVHVPQGMYFVLGDNREESMDSRFGLGLIADPKTQPGIGFIPRDNIIGKAWVIVWPKSHWGTL